MPTLDDRLGVSPSTPPRSRPRKRKIDKAKVLDLIAAGVSQSDIAKHQGVDKTSIRDFLTRYHLQQAEVAEFVEHRAGLLNHLASRSLKVQGMIVDSLLDEDGVLTPLTPHQKTGLISVLSAQAGTLYDKMRLELGQSTSNVSMVHRMMSEAFERAGKLPISSTPISTPTLDESAS